MRSAQQDSIFRAGAEVAAGPTLRVASVPASHVYVRHLAPPDGDDAVRRLADPPPADGRTVPGGWWPPLMLEPGWVRAHHREFDVFHIHFGFDALEPRVLEGVVRELREYGKPLVYTVHDLRNPHHPEHGPHRDQLDILIPAADELITLTPGAAAQVRRRWGREATVLRHPHVVERALIRAPRPASHRSVIGVHVKSLRANMDPLPIIETLAEVVPEMGEAILRVDVHDELFEPGNHWYNPGMGEALLACGERPGVEVRVHPYFSDDELWEYLSSLSVSVLPYRFGTHSGWLEACYDLGTAMVVPSCGFYDQQRPCEVFEFDETRFDPGSLARAVIRACARPAPRATWPQRRAERCALAQAHRRIYERVCGRGH